VRALERNPKVAITIDREETPYHALLIRGTARTSIGEGAPREYEKAATRYMGPEAGEDWVRTINKLSPESARIAVRPEWVGVLDFETRFPEAIAKRMAAAGAAR
jgi:hypothetical protein